MSLQRHIVYLENLNPNEKEHNPLLLEEYKLIQEKIDKLGEDKFKVRSWCFTLLTGGAVAVKYLGLLDGIVHGGYLLLAFIPTVAAFHLVELRQRQIGRQYGFRAAEIERIWRSPRYGSSDRSATPNLASYMIKTGRDEHEHYSIIAKWKAFKKMMNTELYREDFLESGAPVNFGKQPFRAAPQKNKSTREHSLIGSLIVNAEDVFYWVQYLLIIVFTAVLVVGVKIHPPLRGEHEAPEIQDNANELNIDGVRPKLAGESK